MFASFLSMNNLQTIAAWVLKEHGVIGLVILWIEKRTFNISSPRRANNASYTVDLRG
jgi:hypothetical protein